MKRSNVETSTPTSSSKRTRSNEESVEGPPPELLRYEDYEQFKQLMEKSDFAKKLSHPSNQDIVHKIVAETRNASAEDIDGRRKVLSEIIRKRVALLHFRTDTERETPLHQRNIHLDLIKFLIEKGAFVEGVMQTLQLTFVHVAATYQNPKEFHELVAFLLDMGYTDLLKSRDCNGLTPIHLAVYNMEVKKETILLCRDSGHVKSDFLNDTDDRGNNVLAYAVMGGRNEGYLSLLQGLGAEPMNNSLGYSVLHHAAAYGNLDAIKLFGHGNHLYQEARGGLTPVHVALFIGRRNIHDVVKALVERRKDYAIIPDDGGYTPLSWAQTGGLKEIIEPRTVELLQNELAEFKSVLNQENSTRARSSAETETIEGSTAETRRASGQENIAPELELEIDDVESNNEGGTVASDVVSNSLTCRISINDKDEAKTIHEEAVRVPLNDHSIQDATPKASDASEETGRTLVPVEAQNCNTEGDGIVPETDIDELDTLDPGDANNNSSTSATSTKDTVHLGVSNSLDSLNEAVQANGNENEIHGASPVPLDDHANQETSPKAFNSSGETENTVVPIEARNVSKESEIRDNNPEPLVDMLGGSDASNGVIAGDSTGAVAAATYTDEAIHDLVSNSLDCAREEVELKMNAITTILQSRPELLNLKVGEYEKTPILCERVHLELLEFLIVKGADVSATTKGKKETVLHLAARYLEPKEYHKIVIIVQKRNPEILKAATSSEKFFAFHIACYEMEVKKETLQAFQNSGVDLTSRCCGDRHNALSLAVKGGRTVKFLKTLLSLGLEPVAAKKEYENTLVHYAARYCVLDVLEFLIQLSPAEHVNALNYSKKCPLLYALSGDTITENHVEITNLLLHKYGVRHRLKQDKMRNVIHYVAQKSARCSPEEIDRRKQIIDLFTECDDTLLNVEVGDARTALLAEFTVHVELLKYLVGKGCDPRHRSLGENTFLHLLKKGPFSAEEYHELITFLVRKGYPDVLEMRNEHGSTPLHCALWSFELKEETIEVFKSHGGLNQVDNRGRSIIWYACLGRRSLDFIKMLMKKADMGVDDIGISALHVVAEYGDLEVLKYFLELKPEWVNLKNPENGKTPLHVVVERVGHDRNRVREAKNLLQDLKEKKVLTQDGIRELIKTCIKRAGFGSKKKNNEYYQFLTELALARP